MTIEIEVLGVTPDRKFVDILADGVILTFFFWKGKLRHNKTIESGTWNPRAAYVPKDIFEKACKRAFAILKS